MSKRRRYCLSLMVLSVVPIGVYISIYSETLKLTGHSARAVQERQGASKNIRTSVNNESQPQIGIRPPRVEIQSKSHDVTKQKYGDTPNTDTKRHDSKLPSSTNRLNVTQRMQESLTETKKRNVKAHTTPNKHNATQTTDTERLDVKMQTNSQKQGDVPPTGVTQYTKTKRGDVKLNSNETRQYVQPKTSKAKQLEFTLSSDGRIFILGAAIINSSRRREPRSFWHRDKINVYGQKLAGEERLLCCLGYPDGTMSQVPVETDRRFYLTGFVPLPVFNVICANPTDRPPDEGSHPVRVSVTLAGSECESPATGYLKPYLPDRQARNSLAITTKISHGNVSADLVITWMEAYLWLGADKVITYALNNLSSDARAVMEYYSRKGVLDLYDYKLPALELFHRSLPVQSAQTWTDAAVPMFDAFARSSGYTYFSVIDWDEFIIPSGNRTLKQLMERLFAKNTPNAAGFRFKSQYFLTSTSPEKSDVFLKKFIHRLKLPPRMNRPKIIFRPEQARVDKSHDIEPYPGNILLDCPASDAYIRHFRSCVPNDDGGDVGACTEASGLDLVRDVEISTWADNIAEKVRRAKAGIFPDTS